MKRALGIFVSMVLCSGSALAQAIDADLLKASVARAIGPAASGGRIVDVDVHPTRPFDIWAASASGGLWKSVNNGTTWECVFAEALSLGDIAIAPSNPDVIWVGTGEGNNQRSSYAGNGVWRSTDGGKSFLHVGLEESHHIGRVVVDPADPDTAYVAALGPLYMAGEERGLYKTVDGGKRWERVLALGEELGIADVVLDPARPTTLYAASYDRRRHAWNFADEGDSAIYKSIDGGTSWRRLAGGLPKGKLGRIGLALWPQDPTHLFACIDNQNLAAAEPPKPVKEGEKPAEKSAEPAPPQPIGGEIWASVDGGKSWQKRNEKPVSGYPAYYYGQIRVDPRDEQQLWLLGIVVFVSKDGGKTWSEGEVARSLHSDHHALWFDPNLAGRLLLGNDGGLAQTYDAGATWDSYPNLSIAQFYTVSVDPRRPYRVYGGLQDNGVWMGPSRARGWGGVGSNDWRFIGGGDGMYVLADPNDPDTVYLESQFGAISRVNTRTNDNAWIQPPAEEGVSERWNWCSPILLSSFNSQVVYFGSQRLWKSLDRGTRWKAVSGDLTSHDPEKVKGNVPHCTLTTISESPLDPDLLLVGSDDGNVQWSDDGGRSWIDLHGRFSDVPAHRWVSRVELSHHDKLVAWVAFSGFRDDDFTPWVYRTRDGGKSFARVVAGLPEGPVNVVRESPRRKDTVFLGSDAGAFFSIDGGDHWQRLVSDLPFVSVLDLVVHPREAEVVIGTHGRGLFVVDVTPHEQLTTEVLKSEAYLFAPAPSVLWRGGGGGFGWSGDRTWRAANPAPGAPLWLWMAKADAKPTLEIVDGKGKVVRTLEVAPGSGLQNVVWDLRFDPPKEVPAEKVKEPEKGASKDAAPPKRRRLEPGDAAEEAEEEEELDAPFAQDAGSRRRGGRGGEAAGPGSYTVRLKLGAQLLDQPLELQSDRGLGAD